jgi:type II secretion system protein G
VARSSRGLTLVELLAIVAIVGVIVVIALPSWLDAVNRKKQKRTMRDLMTCAIANESYSIDHLQYVASGERGIGELRSFYETTYAKSLPARDGWGTELRYVATRREYTITSYGSDRSPGGGGAIATNGGTTDFKNDVVLRTGSFVVFPDGTSIP